MWWKALGVFLVLLVVGAASGYALGDYGTDQPGTIPSAAPVPAVSPSVPTPPVFTPLPDPTDAALGIAVPSTETSLKGAGYQLSVAIPNGWAQNRIEKTRWGFAPVGAAFNTYVMRVEIIAQDHASVTAEMAGRIAELRDAEAQGNLQYLTIESRTADTVVATYVDHGYLRVTMERWLTLGSSSAYADVAVTGREVDRPGLMDLLARTTESMVAG
jgi:hypothetical protein